MRHADCTGRGLDTCAFKRLHELFEALTLFAAKQIFAFDVEAIEAQLVFLHPTISENLDLATGHASRGEGIFIVTWKLFGKEHRQSLVICRIGIGAGQ